MSTKAILLILVLSILIRIYFELELLIDFLLAYKTSNFRSKSFFYQPGPVPNLAKSGKLGPGAQFAIVSL